MSLESRLRLVETLAQNSSAIGDPEIAALNAFRRVQAYLRRRLREAIRDAPDSAEPARLLEMWEGNWWYRSGMLLPGGGLPDWTEEDFGADCEALSAYCVRTGELPAGDNFDAWWPAWSAAEEWQRPPTFAWHATSTRQIAVHFRPAWLRDPLLAELAGT